MFALSFNQPVMGKLSNTEAQITILEEKLSKMPEKLAGKGNPSFYSLRNKIKNLKKKTVKDQWTEFLSK